MVHLKFTCLKRNIFFQTCIFGGFYFLTLLIFRGGKWMCFFFFAYRFSVQPLPPLWVSAKVSSLRVRTFCHWVVESGRIDVDNRREWLPSRGLTYPTKREKENHLQNAIFGGYVNFLEGTISVLGTAQPLSIPVNSSNWWFRTPVNSPVEVGTWNPIYFTGLLKIPGGDRISSINSIVLSNMISLYIFDYSYDFSWHMIYKSVIWHFCRLRTLTIPKKRM